MIPGITAGAPAVTGEVGGEAHRHWRVKFDAVRSDVFIGLMRLDMMADYDGPTATGSGTPSASSTYSGTSVAWLFDGNDSHGWFSNGGVVADQWVAYDFGEGNEVEIVALQMLPRQDGYSNQAPTAGKVQYSDDGIDWTTHWSFANPLRGSIEQLFVAKPGAGEYTEKKRFWGIRGNTNGGLVNGGNYIGLQELELLAELGGPDLTGPTKGGWTNQYFNDRPPKMAFNNTFSGANNGWFSANTPTLGGAILYDFGEPVDMPAYLRLQSPVSNGFNDNRGAPVNFDLVYSEDGQTLVPVANFTTPNTWGFGEYRTFNTAAPSAGAAHRYWRLYITANNGGSVAALTEFRLFTVPDLINRATGGTPYASTTYGSEAPARAFDGNISSNWASALGASYPHWLAYDLGEGNERKIDAIELFSRSSGDVVQMVRDFEVQWSDDGSTWTTEWSVAGETGWGSNEGRVFSNPNYPVPGTGYRHWRLLFTANNGGSAVAATEIEMLALPDTVSKTVGGVARNSSRWDSSHNVNELFDGVLNNNSNAWASKSGAAMPQWVSYEFLSGKQIINAVAIHARNNTDSSQAPRDFAVQYSEDGVNWTTAWTVSGQTGWGSYERRQFNAP